MTLASFIRTAIFGPSETPDLRQAEARYHSLKSRYEACQSKGDKRGMGEAFREMQPALHDVLRAHSGAPRLHTHRASFSAGSRSVGAA